MHVRWPQSEVEQKSSLKDIFVACSRLDVRLNNIMSRARTGVCKQNTSSNVARVLKASKPKAGPKAKANNRKRPAVDQDGDEDAEREPVAKATAKAKAKSKAKAKARQ